MAVMVGEAEGRDELNLGGDVLDRGSIRYRSVGRAMKGWVSQQ